MKYQALILENEGRQNEKTILSALMQSDVLNDCYAHKSRVKTEEKLLEKVKIRQEEGKAGYGVKDITDVIGLRLITLFRVDMVDVFEKVINIIKHEYNLTPNPFKKDSLEQLIFYTNRTNDKINLRLRDVAIKLEVENKYKMEQRDGEYSSIHIVARANKKITKLSEHGNAYYLPIEIQIRTVFEDAWGEVDHKYGYSIKKGKKSKYNIRNPESILRHLDTLKKFSDACGEYADAIHLEILNDNREDVGIANLCSVESDQATLDLFNSEGIGAEDIQKYIEARALREKGLLKRNDSTFKDIRCLLDAGNIFNELSNKYIADGIVSQRLFYYYSKMNYAFCLLSSNLKKEAEESLHIYEELETRYPDFLLVKMRLAQAYGKNKLIELALKKCDETYNAYRAIIEAGYINKIELPEADFSHMQKYLPKIYGYYLWVKSERIEVSDTISAISKSNVLKKAYFLTEEALENDPSRPSLYNNLIYYAMEMAKLAKIYPKVRVKKEILKSLENNLGELLKTIDINNTESITLMDTIAKVYNHLGRYEDRNKIIDRLIPLATNSLNTYGCDNEIIETIISESREMRGQC